MIRNILKASRGTAEMMPSDKESLLPQVLSSASLGSMVRSAPKTELSRSPGETASYEAHVFQSMPVIYEWVCPGIRRRTPIWTRTEQLAH